MSKITNETIAQLKPCQDRQDNYLSHYKDREFTPRQFMGLKYISNDDKLWVAFRSIPPASIPLVAADIAESVLHIFESQYPDDLRPRKAIEAARSGDRDAARAAAGAARAAAWAAAWDAAGAAAGDAQEKKNRTILLRYWK